MKKHERKKWNEDNILLASQYLKDAYRTFNDPYCETYYINAIELLARSLLFVLYTELSDAKVKAVKEMIGDGGKIEITLGSMLKSHSAYNNNCLNYNKLQNLRNNIIHKGVNHNQLECNYTHNFFVATFKELKVLIENIADRNGIKINLSRLELGFMPHVVNIGEKQSSTLDMITNIYGEEFVRINVKVAYAQIKVKNKAEADIVCSVYKTLSGLSDEERTEKLSKMHSILSVGNPVLVKKDFCFKCDDFNKYRESKKRKNYASKVIKTLREESLINVDYDEAIANNFRYSHSFARKLLGDEYDDFISYKDNA